jgi:D-sedoheptulose 7-phosphate isomerase
VKDKNFLDKYFSELKNLINLTANDYDKIVKLKKIFLNIKKLKKKIIVCGNGGSAAISSHFSVDLTKNAKIRCINFNDSDLITCFANDYGFEKWMEKAIEYYGEAGDVLIAISSSGKSKNILNGVKCAKKKKFSKIITLSGINASNPLRKMGHLNFYVNNKGYNHVENIHQIILLSTIDLIIGKSVYKSNR